MIYIKNSAKKEIPLLQFKSLWFETVRSDDFPFECENYSDDNQNVYYNGIRICINGILLASVGLNLNINSYSAESLFDAFKAIFNKFFEDEIAKSIDKTDCIIDIYDIVKRANKEWYSIIGSSYKLGFPVNDLKKFVYSKLDEYDEK